MRAIVVDDSRAMRMILKRFLTSNGFECFEAVDGVDALVRLRQNAPPELALVDWNMPNMNGHELVCQIRQNPEWNNVKIMMVTTENEMDQVCKAITAGANEYMMKPFTDESLREKLDILGFERAAA